MKMILKLGVLAALTLIAISVVSRENETDKLSAEDADEDYGGAIPAAI